MSKIKKISKFVKECHVFDPVCEPPHCYAGNGIANHNCIIWIEEFEKGLPKAGDRNLDGGTSDTILQGTLDLMQERKGGSFLFATANDVSLLPPELLRKGRWDAIFFVDLPSYEERIEIFNIHLNQRKWKLSDQEIKKLAEQTKNYSGAEIEAACIDGRWKAFSRREELTVDDILSCIKSDVPLYKTMEEQIQSLRTWAEKRARPASRKKSSAAKRKITKKPGGRKLMMKDKEKTDDRIEYRDDKTRNLGSRSN